MEVAVDDVVINGQTYMPADAVTENIAIAITTYNRQDVLDRALKHHLEHLPAGAKLIVIDDGSKTPAEVPAGVELIRNEESRGIAGAKNRALDALSKTTADDWFIFDDDAWPLADDWWKPYAKSPEPHLMAIYDKPKGATKTQVEKLYEDEKHIYYHATRGYMLYVRREVVETVGGMNPAFGRWGWEHQSFSDRIHAAGFTSARYIDVKNSGELIYSMDQAGEIKSTATDESKRFSQGPGLELRMESRNSSQYIEYRELEDIVITTMLCGQDDPQRSGKMSADASKVKKLHDSLKARFIVLATGLQNEDKIPRAEIETVTQSINPYFQRWVNIYQWLREHDEVGRVWCVDATDVTMNRDPFPEMESGKLYFGYEPDTLRNTWMLKNHPDSTIQEFFKSNPNLTLLNMGVVGGDRALVMRFAQKMAKAYFDDYIDCWYGWETERLGVGDMGIGQVIARTEFADVIETGAHVVNVFKSKLGADNAWWHHKLEG